MSARPAVTMDGKVQKIMKSPDARILEKEEIGFEGADELLSRMKLIGPRHSKHRRATSASLPRFFNRHGYPFQSPLAGSITMPYLQLALIDFAIHFTLRRGVSQNILVSRAPGVIRFVFSTSLKEDS
jgi:hypothetical protein